MKTVVDSAECNAAAAARRAADILTLKPDAVFGIDFNHSLIPFFNGLASLCAGGNISMSKAKVFCVGEFLDIGVEDAGSAHMFLRENLIKTCGIDEANVSWPCAQANSGRGRPEEYDGEIFRAGGMDLLVLGIGLNGRLGFNEPATPFGTCTHAQRLTDTTKAEFAPLFGSASETPERGATMGIKTIIAARSVIMLASGAEKADVIHRMVHGKTETYVPASMLQLHTDMTLYVDTAAASKLG